MTDNHLVFLDTETTGLDARIHDAWEVCVWREDWDSPRTAGVPHSLAHADPRALEVGGYWARREAYLRPGVRVLDWLTDGLRGATLVGANPAFDQAFLTKLIGTPVWHYRLVDVCTGAMWLLGWDRPRSLIDTGATLREWGYEVHQADHTAEGDVRAVRDIYTALRALAVEQRQ